MGDDQVPQADSPAAPRQYIEIEHARSPAATGPPPEIMLDRLERGEQCVGIERTPDQRHRIGKVAPGIAVGGIEHNRRGAEQTEIPVEPGDGRADHLRRSAVAAMRTIGAERDGVEMDLGGQKNSVRPEPVEGLPFNSFALGRKTVLRQAQDERYGEA